MKFAFFLVLCFLTTFLVFFDFTCPSCTSTTFFSYLVMYGDFWKGFTKIEAAYTTYIIIAGSMVSAVLWFVPKIISKKAAGTAHNAILLILSLFSIYLLFFSIKIQVLAKVIFQTSSFYENNYIAIQKSDLLKNNGQPKNLILIFAESLEKSYTDPTLFKKTLLPALSGQTGFSFSRFDMISGTDNTISALAAAFCAVPVMPIVPEIQRNFTKYTFPSAVCLPDLLKSLGYNTHFYFSETEKFSNKVSFLRSHGIEHIGGAEYLSRGEQDKGLWDFSAVKDSRLFEFAEQKIRELQKNKKPFFLGLLTINTHEPNGYLEKNCRAEHNDFQDIVLCSDTHINDFIEFVKKTPEYKNTVVIVVGDHISRTNGLFDRLNKNKERLIFNLFVNAPAPVQTDRTFTALDLGPTILEAIGYTLPENGFGLGRSLYTKTPTLIEQNGKDFIENELQKNSPFYKQLLQDPNANKGK